MAYGNQKSGQNNGNNNDAFDDIPALDDISALDDNPDESDDNSDFDEQKDDQLNRILQEIDDINVTTRSSPRADFKIQRYTLRYASVNYEDGFNKENPGSCFSKGAKPSFEVHQCCLPNSYGCTNHYHYMFLLFPCQQPL